MDLRNVVVEAGEVYLGSVNFCWRSPQDNLAPRSVSQHRRVEFLSDNKIAKKALDSLPVQVSSLHPGQGLEAEDTGIRGGRRQADPNPNPNRLKVQLC